MTFWKKPNYETITDLVVVRGLGEDRGLKR